MNVLFRNANLSEREQLLASEKKVALERILVVLLFIAIIFVVLLPNLTKQNQKIEETVKLQTDNEYLVGFTDTEESIIKELYGDRTAYADDKTWHTKTDFIDKEKSAETGEIVYDEEAYQAYYDSFLAEFDAQVDQDKVSSILQERKEAYQANAKAQLKETTSLKNRLSISGQGIALTVLLAALEVFIIVFSVSKVNCLRKGSFLLAEGTLVEKRNRRGRFYLFKPFAVIQLENGTKVSVLLTALQSLSLQAGNQMLIARPSSSFLPSHMKYSICKK